MGVIAIGLFSTCSRTIQEFKSFRSIIQCHGNFIFIFIFFVFQRKLDLLDCAAYVSVFSLSYEY